MSTNTSAIAAFRQVPQGFFQANETLNSYDATTFTQMTLDLLHSFSSHTSSVPASNYTELTSQSLTAINSSLAALSFLLRLFIQHRVTNEDAVLLLTKETELSVEKREILSRLWTQHNQSGELLAPSKLTVISRTLSLGRLVKFSWRLGVGISSSNCANLAAPFITLVFEIAQPASTSSSSASAAQIKGTNADSASSSSSTRSHLVECTHAEFQTIRKHFQDIFLQLDSV